MAVGVPHPDCVALCSFQRQPLSGYDVRFIVPYETHHGVSPEIKHNNNKQFYTHSASFILTQTTKCPVTLNRHENKRYVPKQSEVHGMSQLHAQGVLFGHWHEPHLPTYLQRPCPDLVA